MKILWKCYLFPILLLVILAIVPILTVNNLWSFCFCDCFSFCFYLENLSPLKCTFIGYTTIISMSVFLWVRTHMWEKYLKWNLVSDWTRLLYKNSTKRSWNLIGRVYILNLKNQFWSVKPTYSSWKYHSLLPENHFVFKLTIINYLLSQL